MAKRKLFKRICLLFVLISAVQLIVSTGQYFKHEREKKYLANLLMQEERKQKQQENAVMEQEAASMEISGQETEEDSRMLSKFEKLYQENPDIIGWLSIEGMKINYPVMQNEDDEYYLHHNFQKEAEDKYGCLYVRGSADVLTPGTNFIIYGHNMRDGSMFGDLDFYKTKDFYENHPLISFDTLYEERTYEIVSVFLSQVYKEDEDIFKYYQFYQADTEEEFNYFYQNIKELALYDTGVEAEYGDTFLTLSTCAYHVEDGRLAIVAKKIA